MSREVIEAIHIPLDVVKHLDLKRGRNQGRIYRIAPPGFRFTPPPRLSQAGTAVLVAALLRPDGWYRDTAHRLIYERQDRDAIEPLRKMLRPGGAPLPQSRVNALWSLEGLQNLKDEDVRISLNDPVGQVRAMAVQLAARRLGQSSSLLENVLALADDPDPRVRFQTALALGDSRDPLVEPALLRIARQDASNQWIRSALLSSCAAMSDRLLVDLWNDQASSPDQGAGIRLLIDQLSESVGAHNDRHEIDHVLDRLAKNAKGPGSRELRDRVILALARGMRRSGGVLQAEPASRTPGATLVAGLLDETRTLVLDDRTPEAARVAAIANLGVLDPADSHVVLVKLLEPRQPLAVQLASVSALAEGQAPAVARILLSRLRGFEPSVRAAAIRTLLTRTDWTKVLLEAISRIDRDGGLSPALIEPADRAPLLKHRDPELARSAQKLFGQRTSQSRTQVVAEYLTAIRQKGDPIAGA